MKFAKALSTFIALLSFSANKNLAMGDNNQYVYYGETIYLQNYDVQNSWLYTGSVPVAALGDITTNGWDALGQFVLVQPAVGSANANLKSGTGKCVKFGDQFEIYQPQEQWIAVSDGTNCNRDGCLASGDVFSTGNYGYSVSNAQMLFTIRSTTGNGLLSQTNNVDPLFGQCVQQNSVATIQSTLQNGLFLGVSYGYAHVGNIGAIAYTDWIISSTLSDGSTSNALACQAIPNVTQGSWVPLNVTYFENKKGFVYTFGTTTTDSKSVISSDAWTKSITDTISAGFTFVGASASVSVNVTGEFSGSQASSIGGVVGLPAFLYNGTDFNPGQLWQFVYDTADVCDVTGFSIYSPAQLHTDGKDDSPCCLPGYFKDISNPHGPCMAINGIASPCLCSDDICNGTPSSRGLRGSMN